MNGAVPPLLPHRDNLFGDVGGDGGGGGVVVVGGEGRGGYCRGICVEAGAVVA